MYDVFGNDERRRNKYNLDAFFETGKTLTLQLERVRKEHSEIHSRKKASEILQENQKYVSSEHINNFVHGNNSVIS